MDARRPCPGERAIALAERSASGRDGVPRSGAAPGTRAAAGGGEAPGPVALALGLLTTGALLPSGILFWALVAAAPAALTAASCDHLK